ncbi:MAG: Ig-like domain-containing protein, partial [Clostridiales bacterium]|nr:Ig-like domain-containing protein [Clostridiales bacterium]
MKKKILSLILAVIAALTFAFEIPATAFVDIAEAADYEATLRAAGFTQSYISALVGLHKKYPEWTFQALVTGIDWEDAVANERSPHSQQLIQITSANTKKSYYCTCSSCYKNGSYVIQEGSSWVSASESAVEYYMNPTNFLDEKYIFQFLSTAYNSDETASGVETILSGTFMESAYIKYKNSSGTSVTYSPKTKYSKAIVAAAKNSGLSAYYLAAKIVQEVGGTKNTATGASGTNSTYPGIYNYYNIGASSSAKDGLKWASTSSAGYSTNCTANLRKSASSSSTKLVTLPTGTKLTYKSTTSTQSDGYKWYKVTVTYSGTTYTGYIRSDLVTNSSTDKYNRPWTNPYLSIYNGAVYIATSFSATQYTGYLQKFNVNPDSGSKMYAHEYMANVQAAADEALDTYEAYSSAGLLSSAKTFIIPVFENMPGDVTVESTAVELSSSSIKISAGKTKTLSATLTPSNSTDSLTWTSSDTSVAKVNSNGKITAVAPGTATIKVKTSSGQVAKCKVTVKEVQSTAVSLGYTHKGTVSAKCALRKSKSSDSKKLVTLPKGATVTIKSSASGWYKVSYTKSGTTYTGYVKTSCVTRKADLNLAVGGSLTLSSTLTPSNSTDSVTYTSDDKSIAKVSSSGKIT